MRMNFVRSALLASAFLLAGGAAQAEKLVVGATQVPHAEILEVVKPALAKEGVELDIKVFTDYVQPNLQLADKQLDANFFQHQPYLDTFNKDRKTNLVSVAWSMSSPLAVIRRKSRVWLSSRTAPPSPSRTIPPTAGAPCCCCRSRGCSS
ncbi:D-methionine ABC transporter substrate-binding protein [Bordetella pertussis]|nr:D-methionine ABC transporter substrate-binding protein [Bordetella pertussis]